MVGECKGTHFIKVLMGDFRLKLSIPKKFVSNFKEELVEEDMLLRGPSGNTWPVGLTRMKSMLFFERGWPDFVQDHSLQEADFLLFQYAGNSSFDILMFDMTCCEKESSYFTNDGSSSRFKCECQGNEIEMDESEENLEEQAQIDDGTTLPLYVDRRLTYNLYYITSRRPVTEAEKLKALKAAHAVKITKPGFIQVMKLSHVYKRFYLVIPIEWIREHFPNKDCEVILRVSTGTRKWLCQFRYKETGAGLERGWSRFVMDNNLEEGDVCIFELSQGGTGGKVSMEIAMDVTIFRVVDEVVPLMRYLPR